MPRKITDRLKLINGYLRGQTTQLPGPSALMVETTVRCNLLCPMCPRTRTKYPNEDMPDELLYPLLEEHAALGGDHVYLYGLGEPLMDPRIFDVIERCTSMGLSTILSTNGTFLNKKRRTQLLQSGCDHLLIGLDGATKATYDLYRAGGKYNNVVANIKALAEEKEALGAELYIVVQFIRMEHNWHEQQAFLDLWQSIPGVDEVRIKDEDIGLESHRTYAVDGHSRENACHTLWRGPMVVRWNGDVFPCYPIAEAGEPVGNLRHQSLTDIWNGDSVQQLRELHATGNHSENTHCASCPAARPRLPYVLGAMALRGHTVRKLVPVAEKISHRFPALFSEPRTLNVTGK